MRILHQIVPYLEVCQQRLWLLTLVAKQDLWWDDHPAVERHYRDGEYGEQIRKLTAPKDTRTFRHELVLASLVISNFGTDRQETLKRNTEGYDQRMQVESIRRLMETLAALKDWETGA